MYGLEPLGVWSWSYSLQLDGVGQRGPQPVRVGQGLPDLVLRGRDVHRSLNQIGHRRLLKRTVVYLEWLRWPEGFRCQRCVSRSGSRPSHGRWECSVCGQQSSVTTGTMFDPTRTPLRMWVAAA